MPIEVPSHSVIAVGPGAEKKVKRVTEKGYSWYAEELFSDELDAGKRN